MQVNATESFQTEKPVKTITKNETQGKNDDSSIFNHTEQTKKGVETQYTKDKKVLDMTNDDNLVDKIASATISLSKIIGENVAALKENAEEYTTNLMEQGEKFGKELKTIQEEGKKIADENGCGDVVGPIGDFVVGFGQKIKDFLSQQFGLQF